MNTKTVGLRDLKFLSSRTIVYNSDLNTCHFSEMPRPYFPSLAG
jgi:hypothetical protein